VTTGQPGGFGDPFASHAEGEGLNETPVVIGFRLRSRSVMVGVPRSVQTSFERFVMAMSPSREPAAAPSDATARTCVEVHAVVADAEGVG
jgi:hypothetical protein